MSWTIGILDLNIKPIISEKDIKEIIESLIRKFICKTSARQIEDKKKDVQLRKKWKNQIGLFPHI